MDDGSPFDMDKEYTVATVQYMAERKDGFKDPKVVTLTEDIEEADTNIDLIRDFFKSF